jgi:hypothetical protein
MICRARARIQHKPQQVVNCPVNSCVSVLIFGFPMPCYISTSLLWFLRASLHAVCVLIAVVHY